MIDPWAECHAYLDAHCRDGADFPDETVRYAHVLWVLADCLAVTSVLEIGIGPTAVSGSVWCLNMAQRGGGYLYSIDLAQDRPRPQDRALADACNVRWNTYHGDSLELSDQLPADLQVDVLYVDGDHDFAHAYGDVKLYLPFLRDGGYLIVDDDACDGVKEAIQRLELEGMVFVHLAHDPPHGNGRCLWQKQRTR